MLAFANAKINLGLFLTEKRPDGYHNLQTIFYPVKLFDVIEINDAKVTECKIEGLEIPGNIHENTCLSAFERLQADFDLPNQQLTLLKNIPIGAGLGGGSSDAAFLIKLVNAKFNLQLTNDKMEDYARGLGADCAFFIQNKPVYAFAKGDEFEDLNLDLSAYFLVLVKSPIHVSTAEAYQKVKVAQPNRSLKELINLPLTDWKATIFNDFEESIFPAHPQLDEIKTKLYAAGATFALMSGSGSSVYAIFEKPVTLPELEKDNLVFYDI